MIAFGRNDSSPARRLTWSHDYWANLIATLSNSAIQGRVSHAVTLSKPHFGRVFAILVSISGGGVKIDAVRCTEYRVRNCRAQG